MSSFLSKFLIFSLVVCGAFLSFSCYDDADSSFPEIDIKEYATETETGEKCYRVPKYRSFCCVLSCIFALGYKFTDQNFRGSLKLSDTETKTFERLKLEFYHNDADCYSYIATFTYTEGSEKKTMKFEYSYERDFDNIWADSKTTGEFTLASPPK